MKDMRFWWLGKGSGARDSNLAPDDDQAVRDICITPHPFSPFCQDMNFGDLPLALRSRIYCFAGLIHDGPVEINPRHRPLPRAKSVDSLNFWASQDSDKADICSEPAIHTALFTVSRQIGAQALHFFFTENHFVLTVDDSSSLDVLLDMRPVSLRCIPNLTIQLRHNTFNCSFCHPSGTAEKPLNILTGDCYPLLKRWCEIARRLTASVLPNVLNLTLLCNLLNQPYASRMPLPLVSLRTSDKIAINVQASGEPEVLHLIRQIMKQLNDEDRERKMKPFPFADLPPEIGIKILAMAVLPSLTTGRRQSNIIQFMNGRAVSRPRSGYLEFRPCLATDGEAWLDCLDSSRRPSPSHNCRCWRFSTALFLVSKAMYREVTSLFWPNMTLQLTYHRSETLHFLQSLPASARSLIRNLRFSFSQDVLTDFYNEPRIAFSQWQGVLEHLRYYFDVPCLSVTIDTCPGARDLVTIARRPNFMQSEYRWFLYTFYADMVESFKQLPGLAKVDFRNGYYTHMEPKLNGNAMGFYRY